MDQSKRSPKRKQLLGLKKQKYSWISLIEFLHAIYMVLPIQQILKKMEKILKVIKDIYVNLAIKLLTPLLIV
jgi:hypothetical protein